MELWLTQHDSSANISVCASKPKRNGIRTKSANQAFYNQEDIGKTAKKPLNIENCAQNETVSDIQYDLVELLQQYLREKSLLRSQSKSSVKTQTDMDVSNLTEFVATETQTCNEVVFDAAASMIIDDPKQLNLRMIFDFTNELRHTRSILLNLKKDQDLDPEKQQLVESLHESLETNIHQLTTCIKNIESIPSRCDMLKNKLKLSKKYIMEKENEIQELKKENRILQDKVADITKKFEESTRLVVESDKVCCELQDTISRLKVEVIRLKDASRYLTENNKKLKSSDADNEVMNMKLRINNYILH
ncbi:uncharacterized protein LOC113367325 [Ctenocephalides felis]|uniref:uncharacterized protein LOC113367325 n=1 Tax=Ctenocephalides felis TaxID=7515 RepID=UPI000E6E1444|nr:uncharacterized protein LOC113367325 [Ctenocephalides felis]